MTPSRRPPQGPGVHIMDEDSEPPPGESRPICTFAYLDERGRPQRGTFFSSQASEEVQGDPIRLKRAIQQLCADMGWVFLQIQATIQRHVTIDRSTLGAASPAPRQLRFSRDELGPDSKYGSGP